MILNPSHDITLKGLPPEILDAYVRYKKGSRAIVSWLVQFGPKRYKGVKTLPIKELAALATSVTSSIEELPEVVHFHFRETIAARKRLSQYFRKSIDLSEDDADTVNHEHFTTSLTKIYTDLCKHCESRNNQKHSHEHIICSTSLASPIKNHYACLPIEDSDESQADDLTGSGCDECYHGNVYQCPGPQADLEIENDEMSIAIETASTLERIHEILAGVEACWEKTGRGEAHFVSASAVTNVAWATVRDLENQLRNIDETLSLEALHKRCCLFRDAAKEPNSALTKVHALLESLAESDRTITHYSSCHKLQVIAHCPSCVQKPSDYTQQTTTSTTQPTTSFSLALIDNILHLMCGVRPGTIVLQSSPIFAELGYLLTHRDDESTSFRCVLAIHLLATAYKAHLSTLSTSTTAVPRITALKLSKQASTTITHILSDNDSFPCRCPQTLAFHLSNLKDDMETYTKHKCWDLYFQSPWVAGNHAIEMLDNLAYYGTHLLHYRHYVGAILHSYNVLVQLSGLARIPLLEQLCNMFGDVFFPSGRPTEHFRNCWARYIGARLKFKKGHKRHGNESAWCMAVPAHAAKNAAGLGIDADRKGVDPKRDYARIDRLLRLKQQDWRVNLADDSSADRTGHARSASVVSGNSSAKSRRTSINTTSSSTPTTPISDNLSALSLDDSPSHPYITLLQTLTANIASSPSPATATPTTKLQPTTLSLLSIFRTATALISQITTKSHTEPNEKSIKNCICFAQTLLTGADRIVEGRRFGGVEAWKKDERRVAEIVMLVLKEGFVEREDVVRREWTWEI